MLSADDNRSTGKSGQRGKKKRAGQRNRPGEQHVAAPNPLPEVPVEIRQNVEQAVEQAAEQETSRDVSSQIPSAAALPDAASAMDIAAGASVAPVAPAAGVQTIADAYGDYARKSVEDAWTFLGKLATARSPAEAFELQVAFAKQAYESFVAESQRIAELQERLTRQRVTHFEGLVARLTQTTLEIRATRH